MNKIRQKHLSKLNALEKLGLWISKLASRMEFFIFCCILISVPFLFPQTLSVVQFISSGIIQLVMLPVLAFSAYMSSKYDDARAEYAIEVDERAQKDIDEIKKILKENNTLLKKHATTKDKSV